MTPSKKGYAITFDTSGALGSVLNTKAKMIELGIQMAKMQAEKDKELRNQAFSVMSKNRTVDGRLQADYDLVQQEELSKLNKLSMNGTLTQNDIIQSSNRLNSMANSIQTAMKLYDANNNDGNLRQLGYIPERVVEFQDNMLSMIPNPGERRVQAVMGMQNNPSFTAPPLSSYMIDEGVVINKFVDGYGVSTDALRQGNYIASTETARALFEPNSSGGFRVKRDAYGMVNNDVYMRASENPQLNREMADAVYYEAFRQVSQEAGGAAISWDDFRSLALSGRESSNPVSQGFYDEVIDRHNELRQNPELVYKLGNLRLGQMLDDIASGSQNIRTLPTSMQSLNHYYVNGQVLFGASRESAQPIAVRTSQIKGTQLYSIPKDARKAVPVIYGNKQYNVIPSEFGVITTSSGYKIAVRGNLLVQVDNESQQDATQKLIEIANGKGQALKDVIEDAQNGLVDGVDASVAASLKTVMLPEGEYAITDQTGAVIIGEAVGYDRTLYKAGNAVSILANMLERAQVSEGGTNKTSGPVVDELSQDLEGINYE